MRTRRMACATPLDPRSVAPTYNSNHTAHLLISNRRELGGRRRRCSVICTGWRQPYQHCPLRLTQLGTACRICPVYIVHGRLRMAESRTAPAAAAGAGAVQRTSALLNPSSGGSASSLRPRSRLQCCSQCQRLLCCKPADTAVLVCMRGNDGGRRSGSVTFHEALVNRPACMTATTCDAASG